MSNRANVCAPAVLAAVLIVSSSSGLQARAATFYVSKAGNDTNDGQSWATARLTVQAGISATVSGDQVWVAAGAYVERIQLRDGVAVYGGFVGNETDLSERDWTANVTVIDANKTGVVVTPGFATTASTRIDGFAIRNGQTSSGMGAGIACQGAGPTIANNVITGNTTGSQGGGIYCNSFSSPLIINNIITNNTAGLGAGISCDSGAHPTISNNVISGNIAGTGGSGGGIRCIGNATARLISNNTISGNTAGNGGGIYCSDGAGLVANNRIIGNRAYTDGGGVFLNNTSCTLTSNIVAANISSVGGGIYNYSSSPIVANNTVVGNAATNGGGVYIQGLSPKYYSNIVAFNSSGIVGVGTTAVLQNNCVYNPLGANYANVNPGAGDISVNPQLLAPGYGEFHLKAGSPCVDVGLDSAVQPSWVDMDGQARIQGAHVDIGADEFTGATPTFTPKVVRVSTLGSDANDGSNWVLAKHTVQAGIDAVTGVIGGEVWVAAGTFNERIRLKLYARVFGGFAGTESGRDARNWVTNVTTLDGGAVGAVVTASALGLDASTIDGFTIRNGRAEWGGGFNCSTAAPTIAHNTFTANVGTASGAGFYAENNCSAVIVNNAFVNNTGGAIQSQGSAPFILNNTFAGNTTNPSTGTISLYASAAVISNNIVAFNGAGIYDGTTVAPPTLHNNCVHNPGGTNYSGINAGAGDISMDPLFVNRTGGDYHLAAASPCIDAGNTPAVPFGTTVDLARDARVLDDPATADCRWLAGTCGAAPVVDMGAYEFVPLIPGDFDHDGYVDDNDLGIFETCATGAAVPYDSISPPPGCTLLPDAGGHIAADLNGDGRIDMDDFGIFQRCYGGSGHPADPHCAD